MKRLTHLALVLTAAGALLAACSRPSDLPDGSVSRTKVDFQAPSAGGNPSAETLYVSNGGRGTLEAPTVAVSYEDGADWLTVTVTSIGDRYAIAVQPITTSLAAGTYRATLTLTWASGSAEPTRVSVTLVVPTRTTDPDPGFQTSVEAIAIEAPRGGGEPAAAAFEVVNAGRGAIPVPSIDVAYAGTAAGWLTTAVAAASGGYTVTAQGHVAGLPSGVHYATLTLRAAAGVVPPRTLPVTLTVPPPEVSLSTREVAMHAPARGLDVTASLTVANAGGGQLAAPVATVTYDRGSAASWDGMLDVAVSGTPAQYQLRFTAHQGRSTPAGSSRLPSGTYTATVRVTAPGAAASDSVRVTLDVPAPVMQLSTSGVAFSEYTTCPLAAGSMTVSVSNVGGGMLTAPAVSMPPGVESWLGASVAAIGHDTYAVTMRPKAFPSVQPGAKVETTVMITDPTGLASAVPVRVRFDAVAPELSTARVTPSPLKIWAQVGMGDPAPRTVSLGTPNGCFSAPAVDVMAVDSFDPASWISIGVIASTPHRHDVEVLTSIGALAAGDQRKGTLRLAVSGSSWEVPVSLTMGTLGQAGSLNGSASRSIESEYVLTPLADGRALSTGGPKDEIFDPVTRTWTALGSSHANLARHGALQLADGRVLLCGGKQVDSSVATPACEVMSGTVWSALGSLASPRVGVALAEMPGGRVLVASSDVETPEILDLASGRSTPVDGVDGTVMAKRRDGSILLAGGSARRTWLYSPERDAWTRSGDTMTVESRAVLVPLPDGRVMTAGRWGGNDLWDPRTGAWSHAVYPKNRGEAITLLSSGKVLSTSGGYALQDWTYPPESMELEVFDPALGTWTVVGSYTSKQPRIGVSVTTLASGMVLIAGGRARLWDPGTLTECFTW